MGHYFVMGDNRANSYDSRFWLRPYVPFDQVKYRQLCSFRIPVLSALIDRTASIRPQGQADFGERLRIVVTSPFFLAIMVPVLLLFIYNMVLGFKKMRKCRSAVELVESHLVALSLAHLICFVGIGCQWFRLIASFIFC